MTAMADDLTLSGPAAPSSLTVSGALGIKSTQDPRSAEGFSIKSTMRNTKVGACTHTSLHCNDNHVKFTCTRLLSTF